MPDASWLSVSSQLVEVACILNDDERAGWAGREALRGANAVLYEPTSRRSKALSYQHAASTKRAAESLISDTFFQCCFRAVLG